MIRIVETTAADVKNVQRLWTDGDVMKFIGFPEGLHETDEAMQRWLSNVIADRPTANHYSIYEDGVYCGETGYLLDPDHRSASLEIKLFAFARGRGIATQAVSFAMAEAFKQGAETVWVDPDPKNAKAIALYERLGFAKKPMPEHVIALGEDPTEYQYMERSRD